VTIPSDVAGGTYYLILYVDYPREASEYDETNNTAIIPLAVTAVEPPGATDADFETDQGVSLSASLANSVVNPNMYEPLEFAVEAPPANGMIDLDPLTGGFIYTPDPAFVGVDTFIWTVSYCNQTSESATVTITVLPACDWVFVGQKSPLNGVLYTANAGSVVPLTWRYEEPIGTPVDSSNARPLVNFKGWTGVNCADYDPLQTPAIDFNLQEDPGSSDLRYSGDSWQFNWQSKYPNDWTGEIGQPGDPLPDGCYEITITLRDECVGKTDGGFQVDLK
jgi:hypothetical protein